LGAALWLQKADATAPRAFTLAMFVWICFAFYSQGVWLEGRPYAQRLEWMRLASAALLSGLTYLLWPSLSTFAYVLAAYAAVSGVIVLFAVSTTSSSRREARTAC